jgi:hypothetical protein
LGYILGDFFTNASGHPAEGVICQKFASSFAAAKFLIDCEKIITREPSVATPEKKTFFRKTVKNRPGLPDFS